MKHWREQRPERYGNPQTDTGMAVFLSEALTGEYIMLEEQDDGLEAIIFNGITLAYYDRKTQSVLRID
ncbi:hypothetical protein I4O65_20945 [Enterobacter kobei]|nr:hypothetical protein [Enterobacter kobei]